MSRERSTDRRLLLIDNPTNELAFTALERRALTRMYPENDRFSGSKAQRDAILEHAAQCNVFHYSGHAYFNIAEPLESALILGDKENSEAWLTLRHIFTAMNLSQCRLAIVNGCESGIPKPSRIDELIGLPAGLLFAGALCVVSTLWKVYDLSSALLMRKFHEEWLTGKSVAVALREAQRWLRDDITTGIQLRDELLPGLLEGITAPGIIAICQQQAEACAVRFPDSPPFASPVHWGAFFATGWSYPLSRGDGEPIRIA